MVDYIPNYTQDILFNKTDDDDDKDTDNIQYAGYPIVSNIMSTGGGSGSASTNIGTSRLDGLTIPVGLYIYNYSRETPLHRQEQHIEIGVVDDETFDKLLRKVSHKLSKKKQPNTKRHTKKRRS